VIDARLVFVPVARDRAELEILRREVPELDPVDRGVDDLVGHRVSHLAGVSAPVSAVKER